MTLEMPQRSGLPSPRPMPSVLRVQCTRSKGYDVHLVDDLLGARATFQSLLGHRRSLVVAPREVWAICGSRFRAVTAGLDLHVLVLDLAEQTKSIESALKVCASCVEHEIGRTDVLVALGGGVCCDVVTVAAGLVRRGIAYVCLPTTLVGQIDAGVGIKGAVNFLGKKSFLGSFHPPEVVFVDAAFLSSAPPHTAMDGMAEAVKIALVRDADLFALLEEHGPSLLKARFAGPRLLVRELLHRCIAGMLAELSPNLFEDQTYNRKVDFGHTISGTLEERSGYRISHGHAVSIDMALSASIALTMGRLGPGEFARIVSTLRAFGLPVSSPLLTAELCEQALHSAALHRGGSPRLVIPDGIGSCTIVSDIRELPSTVLQAALAHVAHT